MTEENKKPSTEAEAQAALCSKDWLAAVKRGDRITTYQLFIDWLATAQQGPLYLQQMGERICYALSATSKDEYMRRLVDCALHSERFLQDETTTPAPVVLQPAVGRRSRRGKHRGVIQTAAGPACKICGRGVRCWLAADKSPCQHR